MSSTLSFICVMEMVYGTCFVFFRDMMKRTGDLDGLTSVFYGAMIVFFGQTVLLMVLKKNQKGIVAVLVFKGIMCMASLMYAMSMMTSSRKRGFANTGSLLIYCFAGIPFCLMFQKWGKEGSAGTKNRLGDLSAAERAAQGGGMPLSGAPGSAMGPPMMDMGMPPMSGPPGSAMGYGAQPPPGGWGAGANMNLMPPSGYGGAPPGSGGYGGYPQQGAVRY